MVAIVKPLLPTLFAAGGTGLFTAQVHSGFMLWLVVPVLLPWLVYSAIFAWRNPDRWKPQFYKVGIWLVVVAGVAGLHSHYARSAREAADSVVTAVRSYERKHGSYPRDLAVLNETMTPSIKKWRIYYYLNAEEPHLMYPATHIVFDTYWYDFQNSKWIYRPE